MFKSKTYYRLRVEELEREIKNLKRNEDWIFLPPEGLPIVKELEERIAKQAASLKYYINQSNQLNILYSKMKGERDLIAKENTLLEAENKALKNKLQITCIEGVNGVVLKGSPEEVANFIHFLREGITHA